MERRSPQQSKPSRLSHPSLNIGAKQDVLQQPFPASLTKSLNGIFCPSLYHINLIQPTPVRALGRVVRICQSLTNCASFRALIASCRTRCSTNNFPMSGLIISCTLQLVVVPPFHIHTLVYNNLEHKQSSYALVFLSRLSPPFLIANAGVISYIPFHSRSPSYVASEWN